MAFTYALPGLLNLLLLIAALAYSFIKKRDTQKKLSLLKQLFGGILFWVMSLLPVWMNISGVDTNTVAVFVALSVCTIHFNNVLSLTALRFLLFP